MKKPHLGGVYMNISVTKVMAEYDKKVNEYFNSPIQDSPKNRLEWNTFSDNEFISPHNKRINTEKKIGDQRTIVDFIDFYPVNL